MFVSPCTYFASLQKTLKKRSLNVFSFFFEFSHLKEIRFKEFVFLNFDVIEKLSVYPSDPTRMHLKAILGGNRQAGKPDFLNYDFFYNKKTSTVLHKDPQSALFKKKFFF